MATGDKLVNLDELKLVYDKLHVPSVQVQIPTGQWSGSSTRTYTVNATGITANTIVDWAMDSSINYLKADLTVTPGSGTIQFSTTAIPAGTINVTLFFPGVNGEVVIQTLADVYSKSQTDALIAQSTAKTYYESTSFSQAIADSGLAVPYLTEALNTINTGIGSITANAVQNQTVYTGGPACFAVYAKASDTYYAGIIFTYYYNPAVYGFYRKGSTYGVKSL
jgi:hypothetical protein